MTEVIAICNWERFQHYKDRDPPWIKLYRDLLTAESWVLGNDTSRLVQVASMMLAARYSNRIPHQWELVRRVSNLNCTEKDFHSAIAHLVKTNFLEIQSVTETGKAVVQDASTVLALARSRETEAEAEKRQSREESTGAAPPRANGQASDDAHLAELKAVFPKRAGSQPWSDALKAAKARLREGHSWDEILEGARRYAAFVRAAGIEGTPHVLQAKTFCGPSKRFLEPFEAPRTKADNRLQGNLDAAAEFMRRTGGLA